MSNTRMDKLTLDRIQLLHPSVRKEALAIYTECTSVLTGKARLRFSHTLRTFAEQRALYAQGRTAPGRIVTWAKAGSSYHNYGLAIDIVLLVDRDSNGTFETASWDTVSDFDKDLQSDWMEVVRIFKKYGWEWGGDWKGGKVDRPHFQKTFGKTIAQLRTEFPNGYKPS